MGRAGHRCACDADLESLEADGIWPPLAQKHRRTAEIERDLNRAKDELKGPLKAAAAEVWAQREVKPASPIESAGNCRGCGAERETDGSYCPDCGIKYEEDLGLVEEEIGLLVTDLRNRRRVDPGLRPETARARKAS